MLLIIHNLPPNTRYTDVKALIKDKCGFTEIIVDNLVAEGKSKKVTVGLADEGDAAILMRKINGMYVCDQQLYVEDVRQRKTAEQSYQPSSISNQFEREQYNQGPPLNFDNQFHGQQEALQFQQQPMMSMDNQLPSCLPAPNFGVPFYMTAQNQKVGNNQQFMVQYPKVQGPVGNESYQGGDVGFDQQYGGQKESQSMSPNSSPHREHSPRRISNWNESDCDRSDGRRSRGRPHHHYDADQSYKDKSYRDSFHNRSDQEYGSNKQNSNRFQKPSDRYEPNWERPDNSTFGEKNEYRFNRNVQDRRQYQQKYRENNFSQPRGSDYESRPKDFSKKRPYQSTDKNKFGPQNKKFGSNQEFNSRNQQGASGISFYNNYQNKKNPYMTKFPARAAKELQKNNQKWQSKGQAIKSKKLAKFARDRPAPPEKPTEEMLARHEAWRVQAAAVIATEILTNLGRMRNKRDPIVLKLKACVRARIDVVSGDDMSLNLRDMIYNYREKFQDDDAFYNAVLEKVKNSEQDDFETKCNKGNENGQVGDKMKSDIKPKLQFIGKPPAKIPSSGNTERLPKYPDGDKKVLNQLKQAQKDEMMNESLYNLEAQHEKALSEELDVIDELIKQELANTENETDKSLSKFMNDVIVPDLRKVLTLHVKKRILDVRTNLSVRVVCQYKPPKRDLLDAFLKDYGVISLKASDKNRNVLVAICDSYESFDALCKQNSTVIDNLKVSFRPLHITGPPIKTKYKKQVNSVVKTKTGNNNGNNEINIVKKADNGNDVVSGGNEEDNVEVNSKESENKTKAPENQANEDGECEIIPCNKGLDVIVVEHKTLSNDAIVIDDKVTERSVILQDKNTPGEAYFEAVTGDERSANVEDTVSAVDEEVRVGNDKVACTNSEVIEQEEHTVTDNIADDDLEDF